MIEVTLMVAVAEEPGPNVRLDGSADMEKSGTPVPETVTVIFVE